MSLSFPDVLVAIILFTCVPLQYFITQNWGLTESGRAYTINGFIKEFTKFRDEYLQWESWKKWLEALIDFKSSSSVATFSPDFDDISESVAVEVLQYKEEDLFGFSSIIRNNRSPDVKFHIGQVMLHKTYKYRAVIIGWDESAKAPPDFLKAMEETLGNDEKKVFRHKPSYSVLVDVRDRLTPQFSYVPEENIEVIQNTKVIHPLIDSYFENFDGFRYIPRPWLKTRYPQD